MRRTGEHSASTVVWGMQHAGSISTRRSPLATFDDVRRIALSLPDAEERTTWEVDTTFRVRDRIFAMGGPDGTRASIKATPIVQADLLDRDPATFRSAAYVGRFGWIDVDLARIDVDELNGLITEAWRLTAPKRLAATLDR